MQTVDVKQGALDFEWAHQTAYNAALHDPTVSDWFGRTFPELENTKVVECKKTLDVETGTVRYSIQLGLIPKGGDESDMKTVQLTEEVDANENPGTLSGFAVRELYAA